MGPIRNLDGDHRWRDRGGGAFVYVLVWDLDTDAWEGIARRAAGRDITEDEWRQYGPTGVPYREVCGS